MLCASSAIKLRVSCSMVKDRGASLIDSLALWCRQLTRCSVFTGRLARRRSSFGKRVLSNIEDELGRSVGNDDLYKALLTP